MVQRLWQERSFSGVPMRVQWAPALSPRGAEPEVNQSGWLTPRWRDQGEACVHGGIDIWPPWALTITHTQETGSRLPSEWLWAAYLEWR